MSHHDSPDRSVDAEHRDNMLWWLNLPIHQCPNHPAMRWLCGYGNGLVEEDNSAGDLPAPVPCYYFRDRQWRAYLWQKGRAWWVRLWARESEPTEPGRVR
jgi:hypothetical protein